MSTDTFEDELRSLLHDSADAEGPAYVDVDPGVVVVQGRRAVRRRRAAIGLGAVAAAVTVGLAALTTVGSGLHGAEPVPGSSATIRTTGTATADLSRGARFSQEDAGTTVVPHVRVTVDRSSRKVSYLTDRDGALETVGLDSLPSSPQAASWQPTPVQGLVMGVLPASARDVALLWAGRSPGSTQAMEPLLGTAFQAFAVWHDGSASQTTLAGLDWTDGEAVYRADGSRVNSARLGGAVAFVDSTQDIVGIFGDGSNATKTLSDVRFGEVPVLMTGTQEGSDALRSTLLLVLPAGAHDVVVTAAPGATVESTDYANGGSTGETLVVARMVVPTEVAGTGARTVSWTGADGRKWSNPATGSYGQ